MTGVTIRQRARRLEAWTTYRLASHLGAVGHFRPGPRTSAPLDLSAARNVLIVRLDEIGDLVMTSALLREVRRCAPHARLTLLVKPANRNLVERCPYVDVVRTFDATQPRHARAFRMLLKAMGKARAELRDADFDVAIVPRWDADTSFAAVVAFLSGARRRVGYSETVTAEKARVNHGLDRLFTDVLDAPAVRHEVQRSLDLLRFAGGTVQRDDLEVWTDSQDEARVDALLSEQRIAQDRPLVALGVGAGHPRRIWPMERFTDLAAHVLAMDHAVVVVGGEGDVATGDAIARRLGERVVNAAGRTTLRETAALLRRCHLFVGNDAGPMHIAAAAGLPVVEVSCHPLGADPTHVNSPERFGPWGVPHLVLRPTKAAAPCLAACCAARPHCIAAVPVSVVQEAIATLLQGADEKSVAGTSPLRHAVS